MTRGRRGSGIERAGVSATVPAARRPDPGGFSLVELVVALAIGVAVITVAVIIFQALGANRRPGGTFESLTLANSVMLNFYGEDLEKVDAFVAPSYGRRAQADRLRDLFWEDVGRASAVFCLGRNGLNTQRPTTLTVPADFRGQATDTPEAFRALLADPAAFEAYRGPSVAKNASIFMLRPSANPGELLVQAIYEVDFVTVDLPAGIYASVRRHVGAVTTDYYDVFYPEVSSYGTAAFSPVVVAFERSARRVTVVSDAVDRLKVSPGGPFYFVFWPDPAVADLKAAAVGAYPATDPRASYAAMGGRTSLFMAVPMFPAL